MKPFLISLLLLMSGMLLSQTNSTLKLNFPSVDGDVFEAKAKLKNVNIKVYNNNKLITTKTTDSIGHYSLTFNLDSVYIIELSKDSFITKKYEVCTKELTKARLSEPINKIIAETEMHKMIDGVDYTHYQKPMVKFFYNKKTGKFEYDTKHFAKSFEAQKAITEKEKKANYKAKLKKK
jgi:hypothetical protein